MPEVDADRKTVLVLPEGEFEFDADRLLTRSVLSHFKGWYNDDRALGTYWGFQSCLSTGDPDATSCAVWAIRRREGYSPNTEPKNYARRLGDPADFPVGRVAISRNRRSDLDPPRWKFHLSDTDEELILDMDNDVMCSHLRIIQKRYPHLASFAGLYLNLLRGDPDAVAVGIWCARIAAGVNPNPLPWDIDDDFSVGSVSAMNNLPDDEETSFAAPDPTVTGSAPTDGTRTREPSGSSEETQTTSISDGSEA